MAHLGCLEGGDQACGPRLQETTRETRVAMTRPVGRVSVIESCGGCWTEMRAASSRQTTGAIQTWWRVCETRVVVTCKFACSTTMAQAVGQQAPTRTHLSLKGSTALVHEFFNYSVQSILYQRSIYPSEDFRTVKKFGLPMLTTTDDELADYLDRAMQQLKKWLEQGKVRRLVVAIVEKESQETVERWQFDVEVINTELPEDAAGAVPRSAQKTDAQVKAEIAAIIKQITASCTFLPMLEEPCAFQILAYTDRDVEVPVEWTDSNARLIAEGQAEQVKLRSFSTHVHRVDAMVAYRREEDV